jgi:hypothetical protein
MAVNNDGAERAVRRGSGSMICEMRAVDCLGPLLIISADRADSELSTDDRLARRNLTTSAIHQRCGITFSSLRLCRDRAETIPSSSMAESSNCP